MSDFTYEITIVPSNLSKADTSPKNLRAVASWVNSASYEKWVDAYQAAYVSPPGAAGITCPNCGALELQLVFTTLDPRDRGMARMWCANCLNGVFMAPCQIPDYVEAINEGEVNFPNFTLVPPGYCGGEYGAT